MKKTLYFSFIYAVFISLITFSIAFAHPGNTDSYGCHTCRTNCSNWGLSTGEYHCHNSKGYSQPEEPIHSVYGSYGTGYTTPAPDYSYDSYPTIPTCPANSYYDGISSCTCNYGYIVQGSSCVSGLSYCYSKFGYNSNYDSLSKQCECDAGYSFDGNSCVSATQSCQKSYGINSYGSGELCYCNSGYQFNDSKTSCVPIPVKTTPIFVPSNNEVCQNDFGRNSIWDGTTNIDDTINCICKAGYSWAPDKKSCRLDPYKNEPAKVNKPDSVSKKQNETPPTISTPPVPQISATNNLNTTSKIKWYIKVFNWLFS